ncbi:unnamed protein product [Moneuplotes crassus]|uniref:Uncharacterized protein n=2 Tax=Euplotes crassus TaxID=5936 RepID=A0AAD1UMC8_EUPCR|nr:unnamed protein product [Moneuplotes crassus]
MEDCLNAIVHQNHQLIEKIDHILAKNQEIISKEKTKLGMYDEELDDISKKLYQNNPSNEYELYHAKDSLNERLKIIHKISRKGEKEEMEIFEAELNKSDRIVTIESKIRTLICAAFGFCSFSEFEWNMIIDHNTIMKNLNEVDIYMFDDEEIKDQISVLQRELDNDETIMDVSLGDKLDFSYPVIKTRYDDADIENIPHHVQGIDPLLYHLLIWATLKNSILEMSDEDLKNENSQKLLQHKKECLRNYIDNFKSKLRKFRYEQSDLLDLKINFQKVTERILAYFRQKKKPRKIYKNFEHSFLKDTLKSLEKLHNNPYFSKDTEDSKGLKRWLENDRDHLRFLKEEVMMELGLADEEELYSQQEESEDEGNITIENFDNGIKHTANVYSVNFKERAFTYKINNSESEGGINVPNF